MSENFVPEWSKKVVWYQIFPERFRNGDKNNDPKIENLEGAYPHDVNSIWQVHPWNCDWYELEPYEQKNGKGIWFNIQRRRFGGDLQGILDKLDYLQELGITAVYLNPIFEAPSSHKYDGATYHHVDPNFGPNPEEDRKLIATEVPDDPKTWVWTSADKLALKLIEELHKRKMRIIFDGVFNHFGINSWAFRDVEKKQQNSRFKDWFVVRSWKDEKKPESKFDYNGWYGVRELPEIQENTQSFRDYVWAITERWMKPNGKVENGIDGWRLDVAFCVPHDFWKDWRKHVKSINTEAYLTAEVIEPVSELKPYLQGDEFDAVMNYNFAFASSEFFIDEKTRISVTEFDKLLVDLRNAFTSSVAYGMQNLFGSHDTHRIGSAVANPDIGKYRNWGDFFGKSKGENQNYDVRKPNEEQIKKQKLFVIFQMTYVGSPMIYYGDEAGIWGANDPCCRKPMIWEDLRYKDETYLPEGSMRLVQNEVKFDGDLFEHYKKLISIRNSQNALQLGDFKTVLIDDQKELYAFSRSYKNEQVIVLLNNSLEKQTCNFKLEGNFQDVLNEKASYKKGQQKFELEPKWAKILVRKN
ncbi:glycoside hydrolase family 13 protein [bacterium]|nr:glycoside hydrolase family 13 protein [bacterium]